MAPKGNVEPLLVTVTDACAILGIGITTLYDLMNEGKLERIKIGRSTRIKMSSIRAFIGEPCGAA